MCGVCGEKTALYVQEPIGRVWRECGEVGVHCLELVWLGGGERGTNELYGAVPGGGAEGGFVDEVPGYGEYLAGVFGPGGDGELG